MKITNKQRKRAERRVEDQVTASLASALNLKVQRAEIECLTDKAKVEAAHLRLNVIRIEQRSKDMAKRADLHRATLHYLANAAIWPTT